MMKIFAKYKFSPTFAVLIVFVLTGLAIAWRFAPWMPSVFYGDDLDYLLSFEDGRCATTAAEILTATCYERFRPFTSSVVMTLMAIADHDIKAHQLFNVMLHALIATMVFVISRRLSGGRWLVSFALSLAVATSRFATYQVTQMLGPIEGLTLLSVLIAVYAALRADARISDSWRWGWIAIAASLGAIHAHERSVVVAVWLTIAFILSPTLRELPRSRWLALLAGTVAVPIFNVAYKIFVLHTSFFVGTGGTHVELQAPLLLEHARQAAKSLLAFNEGPEYLVGRRIDLGWLRPWLLALTFTCAWAGAILVGFFRVFAGKSKSNPPWQQIRWPLLMLMLAAFLLAPALVTIRLEQRWLLAPFVIGLLVIAWAAGTLPRDRRRSTIAVLAVVLAFASFAVDTAVMRHYDRLFFISSPRYAALVKREIVDRNPGQSGDIALLAGADQCNWTLFKGGFFRIYGGKARVVHCFATLDDAKRAGLPAGTHIYGPDGAEPLVDLTDKKLPAAQAGRALARVDFIDGFAQGKINDTASVQTPTGQGALLLPIDAQDGTRQTLIVLSGFVYSFEGIVIEADDHLRFGVGMIYPAPQSARAIVRIEVSGQPAETLYSKDLAQPPAGAKPSFLDVSLSLGKYTGQSVALSFAVESPGGDLTAHWIGFADPHISHEPAAK